MNPAGLPFFAGRTVTLRISPGFIDDLLMPSRVSVCTEAVVSFHGLLDTGLPAAPGSITARILVCHGDADPMVPRSQVLAFWEEMDAAGADWHFHSYAGVKHGFTNPVPPPGNPAVAYDASADRQSWAAMLGLFDEVLG